MSGDVDALGQDLTPAYLVGARLGQGAFGAVHRARDVAAGRDVALKLLIAERQGSAASIERFLREAAVAASLEHPGVVKVHAVGRHGGRLAIVYELVEGEPFSAAVRTRSPRQRAELLRDAARAVGHAHSQGVVHRDLKPDNLLVDRDGRLRVADFGLAWYEGADRLTRTGGVVGTPHYMAPELFHRHAAAAPTSDVWALGVTLYEALTGRLPFDGPDLMHLMARLQHATLLAPRQVDPSIDPGLEAVCLRALQRDAALRYPDGEALARALDDALAGRSAPAGRGRWWLAPLGAAALSAALGAVAFVTGGRADRAPAAPPTLEPTPPGPPLPPSGPAAASDPGAPSDRHLVRARTARWALWADARRVVTGGADDDVRLLDAVTGEELRAWRCAAGSAARAGAGRVALACADGLRLLSVEAAALPEPLAELDDVKLVACAQETGLLAVVARTRGDARVRPLLVTPGGRPRPVPVPWPALVPIAIALDAAGTQLVVALREPEMTIAPGTRPWELPPEGPVARFDVSGDDVSYRDHVLLPGATFALAFLDRGDLLLAGSTAGQLGVIPRESGDMVDQLRPAGPESYAHDEAIRALALSSDGRRLLSVADRVGRLEVKTWAFERRALLPGPPLQAPGQALTIDLSPDGRALVVGTTNAGVHVRALPPAR